MLNTDLSFTPKETLTIRVSEGHPAQTTLRIGNLTAENVAFKVKTTTPERYLVKPNHGLIRDGCNAEIAIIIVHAKKKDILAKATLNGPINCNDKFLVQSATIDSTIMDELESRTSHELADAITRLFGKKAKKELRAKKLPVELLFVDLPVDDVNFGDERGRLFLHKPLETTAPVPIPGTPEAMFAEIVALRKKYDDLVAFTVNLTAERDSLSADLAVANSSLQGKSHTQRISTKSDNFELFYKPGGYRLIIVIALGLLFCLLGLYIPPFN